MGPPDEPSVARCPGGSARDALGYCLEKHRGARDRSMPDEFPTLEAVAAIATLAALLRTVQVFGALGEVRRSSVEIAEALGRGDRAEARRVCERSEGRAFARLATALLDTLDARPVDVEELTRTVEHAALRVRRRSRRASASGALVGILLVGLLF